MQLLRLYLLRKLALQPPKKQRKKQVLKQDNYTDNCSSKRCDFNLTHAEIFCVFKVIEKFILEYKTYSICKNPMHTIHKYIHYISLIKEN